MPTTLSPDELLHLLRDLSKRTENGSYANAFAAAAECIEAQAADLEQSTSKDWAWRLAAMLRFLKERDDECPGDHPDWIAQIDVLLLGPDGTQFEGHVQRIARLLSAKHYAEQLRKPINDPQVVESVNLNWSMMASVVRLVLSESPGFGNRARYAGMVAQYYRREIGRLMHQAEHWLANGKPMAVHHRVNMADAIFQVLHLFEKPDPFGDIRDALGAPEINPPGIYPPTPEIHRYRSDVRFIGAELDRLARRTGTSEELVDRLSCVIHEFLEKRFPGGALPGGRQIFADDTLDANFKHEAGCAELARAILAALPSAESPKDA